MGAGAVGARVCGWACPSVWVGAVGAMGARAARMDEGRVQIVVLQLPSPTALSILQTIHIISTLPP